MPGDGMHAQLGPEHFTTGAKPNICKAWGRAATLEGRWLSQP